ncbi:BglII/BstYI family type II restriction endonuclease [Bradyrhizobium diazoefficiens]|uniref:BglII/BstYI family type II restriction endonuclease n=1 Tax=Bradyrhizobium diazoefficiens TaxID=1355477 RepID=UPI0027152451|nr:BglII/BstYI family type II restriction endonuclease [Bradyrhizobium diazoefficiens]WLC16299.1 BglII/BstYI family type II restriction endonuclease [Bradyrhizobium diazoefficiens]
MPAEKTPTTIDDLKARGIEIEYLSHARAILSVDFPEALTELAAVLDKATIPIEEIIAGGEAKGTQRLRRALTELKWPKTTFTVQKIINGKEREAISREIDHVRTFEAVTIALEIEWKNKDPFFDL